MLGSFVAMAFFVVHFRRIRREFECTPSAPPNPPPAAEGV
jgi:hypothetical protein